MPAPRMKLETITPEVALKWLDKNVSNRPLRQRAVDELVRDLQAGNYHVTGDPIRFDEDGNLADGQHRLWMCVEADLPFQSYVLRGLDNEAKLVLDTGIHRTLGDALGLRGKTNSVVLSSIVNLCWKYDNTWSSVPTHHEALTWIEQNPGVEEAPRVARAGREGLGIAPSPIGAAYYLNARTDLDAAEQFWQSVSDGIGLTTGDPILALRRWAATSFNKRDKPASRVQFAYHLKAMNLWRAQRSVRQLHWKPAEGFPRGWQTEQSKKGRPTRSGH